MYVLCTHTNILSHVKAVRDEFPSSSVLRQSSPTSVPWESNANNQDSVTQQKPHLLAAAICEMGPFNRAEGELKLFTAAPPSSRQHWRKVESSRPH